MSTKAGGGEQLVKETGVLDQLVVQGCGLCGDVNRNRKMILNGPYVQPLLHIPFRDQNMVNYFNSALK